VQINFRYPVQGLDLHCDLYFLSPMNKMLKSIKLNPAKQLLDN